MPATCDTPGAARYTVYLPADDDARLRQLALDDGRTTNTWLRDAALAAVRAGRHPPPSGLVRGPRRAAPRP